MVAQDADHRFMQRMHQTQGLQRLSAAVDQIATQPQGIAARLEPEPVQQTQGGIKTPLQVANCPDGHQ